LPFDGAFRTAFAALSGLEGVLRGRDIDEHLVELVRLRASQINRCEFCIGMHIREAFVAGIPLTGSKCTRRGPKGLTSVRPSAVP